MNSLKKALAGISMLAIIFVSFSCSNASDDEFINDNNSNVSGSNDITNNNGNDSNGDVNIGDSGEVVVGSSSLKFDLSNAKGFFAGKASASTASRSAVRSIYDDNNIILMKIADDGTTSPAMDFQGSNINFNLKKILKNPATKELFLLGYFYKGYSGYYDENNKYVEDKGWEYHLIRVDQYGNWYGLPFQYDVQITQEPFDEQGNFYFQCTDYSASTPKYSIYKYSGSSATKIVDKAKLQRVLPNGAIIYSIENSGIGYTSYYYIRLRDEKVRQLDDYSTSVYVKDKNIFYYSIKYIRGGENTYYIDDAGNRYTNYDGSGTVYYANKGGKKIYVTEDGDSWKDENGKSYDSHVFSDYYTRYWNFTDTGNKIYLTYIPSYYIDIDGNKYNNYDGYENNGYYVYNDKGTKIKVEYSDWYYEDDKGNKYNSYDKSESKTWYWVYEGGELVEVEYKNGDYQDADGNKYSWDEVFENYEYYVITDGKKVKVKPIQTYSTDVIVAKYYDFIANTTAEAVAEADFSSYDSYNFATSSENVFGTTFITNSVGKFEIQKDFSLKCEYNLSEKGYTVATSWESNYNFIGENSNRYLEKFLYNGDKIYFLGTKGDRWSSDSTYNLYKIIRFGEPQSVLSSADASNYEFNGNITFDDDGDFIGSVLRKSDGKWGTLSGSMEYGNYEFKEDSIFESVKDIVINFD